MAKIKRPSEPKSIFKNRLWIHRKKMGYSQEFVALLLGHRNASRVSDYELGKRMPCLETALKLEVILCAPVAFLFRDLHLDLREDVRRQRDSLESQHRE